ncbi:MAG: MerR family transcriptional regulator [Deltaproteobacteria bacterium]|nr:MerR family transcriptional regulator [Deltaproteobacteria bacterium]
MGKGIYPIGVAADLLQVHPRTLRIYEQENLIKPERRNGRRYYSDEDMELIRCIRKLIHEDGINLTGVKRLMEIAPCWKVRNCRRRQCGRYRKGIKGRRGKQV